MKTNTLSVGLACMFLCACEWWYGASEKDECLSLPSGESLVLDGACYRVAENIAIGMGESVVIGEGTKVRFDPGATVRVQAGGRLVASGSAANPVQLTPSDCGWGGIVFEPGSSGSLQGTIVKDGGFAGPAESKCSCDMPAEACVTIMEGAEVTLEQVGLENCAAKGVAGQPASSFEVGCGSLGMCDPTTPTDSSGEDCVVGGATWCAEDDVSACWDPDSEDDSERECEIGDRRCSEDRFVQACVGGKWTLISDCAGLTNGQTACRAYDGFPRCGLPGPAECLKLPEQPSGTYIPGCDEEGCPAYKAACRGDDQAETCEDSFPVAGCLHPNTLAGPAVYTGLGPRWMRMILYNWGGIPDTTQGSVKVTVNAPSHYVVRTWVQPRKKYERNYCGWRAVGGGGLNMPPPGEQYEVLFEVSTATGPTSPPGSFKNIALVNTSARWWDEEVVVWRQFRPDEFYATCRLKAEAKDYFAKLGDGTVDFFTNVCVDPNGRFVDENTGDLVDGFPDLSVYPAHRDPKLEDCDTWELVLEYVDQDAND